MALPLPGRPTDRKRRELGELAPAPDCGARPASLERPVSELSPVAPPVPAYAVLRGRQAHRVPLRAAEVKGSVGPGRPDAARSQVPAPTQATPARTGPRTNRLGAISARRAADRRRSPGHRTG